MDEIEQEAEKTTSTVCDEIIIASLLTQLSAYRRMTRDILAALATGIFLFYVTRSSAQGDWMGSFLIACSGTSVVAWMLLFCTHWFDAKTMEWVANELNVYNEIIDVESIYLLGQKRFLSTYPYQQALEVSLKVLGVASLVGCHVWGFV